MFLNVILFNPYFFKPQKKMKSNISCSYIELYVNLAVVENILRSVVQTKALVRTTIFYIVEVKKRSCLFWGLESV